MSHCREITNTKSSLIKKKIGVVVIYLFIRRGLLLLFSNDMIKELELRKISKFRNI